MTDKKVIVNFTALTFGIAYLVSGVLIVLGPFGYRVYSWVDTLPQFCANIPFAVYILSPAIASYLVLKRSHSVTGLREWLRTVFHAKNSGYPYLLVIAGLVLYFSLHAAFSGRAGVALPFYMFFLSLPGNLLIGGLEEAGWSYILQPGLDKRFGYATSCLLSGMIWILWHIPLFFLPGTRHAAGLIPFGMFAVQCMALRFFLGAVRRVSGKSGVFMCVLFHTMFNAASSVFAAATATWPGTSAANAAIVLVSILIVAVSHKKQTHPI
ncbi:CPBP family intramembrane glutamic endopeptidase [Agathobaculum sp.]|uniref:CPBP family intramembrane glutamic endopeptidase n=1 Tax=Agathobaculum sp. TaxID=2048138 RepID=UPI0039A3D148